MGQERPAEDAGRTLDQVSASRRSFSAGATESRPHVGDGMENDE